MREAAAFIRSFPGTTTVYGMKGGPGATDFSYAVCPPTDPEVLEGDEWAQVEDAEIDEALGDLCESCDAAGVVTLAIGRFDQACPECGAVRQRSLCAACADVTRQAPAEARWCKDCRRKAAMASRGD